ncbi:erv26 super protein [Entomophthora muscae]|uniref:Erv26 super protein n=1 Tax=Entomophthora muscae TaxID=34485 RepID=A0ACC2RDV0_9FUNG|nr:erv26 super protein [Entomophthora muscae]
MLHVITAIGIVASLFVSGFCFICGVIRTSDLIEEYPKRSKLFIKYAGATTIAIHILLWWFDSLPALPNLIGIFSQAIFACNLKTYPITEVISITFIATIISSLINHFTWLFFFLEYNNTYTKLTAVEITMFFMVIVWLVPFSYLLALTESHGLPLHDESGKAIRPNILKGFFLKVGDSLQSKKARNE